MGYSIGPVLTVGGEAEFKRAMDDVRLAMRGVASEAALATSGFEKNEKSVKSLSAQNETLKKAMDQQAKAVKAAEEALTSMRARGIDPSHEAYQKMEINLNNAKAALNRTEQEIKANEKAMAGMTDKWKDAAEAAEKASKKWQDAGKAISGLGDKLLATATAAATAISALVISTAAYADEVLTTAEVTGLSTEELQKFNYMTELVDVSVETLTGSMTKNIRSMKAAQDGTKLTAEAYEKLGVEYLEMDGTLRDGQDVFWDVIDALGAMSNETERDAVAMQLLGRSARDLTPLINAGSQQIRAFGDEAVRTGYVLSGEALDALGAYDDQIQRLKLTVTATKNELALKFLPIVSRVTEQVSQKLTELSKAVQSLTTEQAEMVVKMIAWTAAIGAALAIVGRLITGIGALIGAFGQIAGAISAAGGVAAVMAGPAGWIALAVAAFAALTAGIVIFINKNKEAATEASKVSAEVKKIQDEAAKSAKAFDEQVVAVQRSAAEIRLLTERVIELGKKENRTAGETELLKQYIDELNAAVPELSLAWDEQANSLSQNTVELQKLVDAYLDLEMASLVMERNAEIAREMLDIDGQLAELDKARNELIAEAKELEGEYWDAYHEARATGVPMNFELAMSYQAIGAELSSLSISEQALLAQKKELKTAFEENVVVAEEYKSGLALISDHTQSAASSTGGLTSEINNFINAEGEAVTSTDEFNRAVENLSNITQNAFSRMKENAAVSMKDMIANLKHNQDAVSNFYDNLDELGRRFDELGIGDEFLEYLRTLGPEYSGTIQGMVASSDSELAELAQVWADGGKEAADRAVENLGLLPEGASQVLKDLLEETNLSLADLITAYADGGTDAVQALIEAQGKSEPEARAASRLIAEASKLEMEVLPGAFEEIGLNAGNAFARALRLVKLEAGRATQDFVKEVIKGAEQGLEIQSPSRKFMEIGRLTAEGFVVGMEKESPRVMAKMRGWARQWQDSFAGGMLAMNSVADSASSIRLPARQNATVAAGQGGYGAQSDVINVTQNITSPTPLTPAQVARETKNALRRLVWA